MAQQLANLFVLEAMLCELPPLSPNPSRQQFPSRSSIKKRLAHTGSRHSDLLCLPENRILHRDGTAETSAPATRSRSKGAKKNLSRISGDGSKATPKSSRSKCKATKNNMWCQAGGSLLFHDTLGERRQTHLIFTRCLWDTRLSLPCVFLFLFLAPRPFRQR